MRVAVIGGGAGGIGAATAGALARDGHAVALADRRADALDSAVARLREAGAADVLAVTTDLTDRNSVDRAVAELIAWHGRIDVLVNAAGITRLGTIEEVDESAWDSMLDVNLKATYLLCRAAHAGLVANAPSAVVNVSSVSGRTKSVHTDPSYVSSKAGVIGLTMSLAGQWARDGVRVNCVAPGLTDTEMAAVYTPQQRTAFEASIPLGRFARPDEIADAISFLASERASYITGAVLDVNGGLFMG